MTRHSKLNGQSAGRWLAIRLGARLSNEPDKACEVAALSQPQHLDNPNPNCYLESKTLVMSDLISQFRLRLAPDIQRRRWPIRGAWPFATLHLVLAVGDGEVWKVTA